jgi:poly(A) polymerase
LNRNTTTPVRLGPAEHGIHPDGLDADSIEVISRLQSAGFHAYLVGGCVRDLLLGFEPKDFDVATDATPDQVKSVFRRARLVGRRFQIAHVRFGRNIIEVSTFRKSESDGVELDSTGMILSDNEFGSLEEDAWRRDFTINALYYDPICGDLLDYVGALADLRERRIAFIGKTSVRLAEDPVRALRALRFQAKLRFDLCSSIHAALPDAAARLQSVPSARLFEEFNKLFLLGYAHAAWIAISTTPLHRTLFPCTPPHSEIVSEAMRNTDERIAAEKPTTPGFLIAVLLWQDYSARLKELTTSHPAPVAAEIAAEQCIAHQATIIAIPRRFSLFAREVWSLQPKLTERQPRFIDRVYGHKRFRAAYDLLELRARIDPALQEVVDWWMRYQAEPDSRSEMLSCLPTQENARKPRRRRRKARAHSPLQSSES